MPFAWRGREKTGVALTQPLHSIMWPVAFFLHSCLLCYDSSSSDSPGTDWLAGKTALQPRSCRFLLSSSCLSWPIILGGVRLYHLSNQAQSSREKLSGLKYHLSHRKKEICAMPGAMAWMVQMWFVLFLHFCRVEKGKPFRKLHRGGPPHLVQVSLAGYVASLRWKSSTFLLHFFFL